MTDRAKQLTARSLLARNAAWNLIGLGGPLIVGMITMPILIHALGPDRVGIIELGWLILGYLSLSDLGIGRALTLVTAEKLGQDERDDLAAMFWTGIVLISLFGIAAMVVCALLTPWLVQDVFRIPSQLHADTRHAFYLFALALPFDLATAGLRSVLEALQRFRVTSSLRIGMGLYTFLAPLIVLPFSHSVTGIVAVWIFAHIIQVPIHLVYCLRSLPELQHPHAVARRHVGRLLRSGGWMTITNTVTPLVTTFDRFLLGALISVTAVTYYATAYDVASKLLIIPWAVTGVVFPAFASTYTADRAETRALFHGAVRWTLILTFPAVFVAISVAREFWHIWLGGAFAAESTHALQLLAVGVLANGVAQLPQALLQGTGRTDLPAKLQLIELPITLAAMWIVVDPYGINGVAAVWAARSLLDLVVLQLMAYHYIGRPALPPWQIALWLGGGTALLVLAAVPMAIPTRAAFVALALLGYSWLVIRCLLSGVERRALGARLYRLAHPNATLWREA